MTLRKEFASRVSKRVTNTNPGHVKGVHDVNEVAIFWLVNLAKFIISQSIPAPPPPHQKNNGLLVVMYSSFVHILILSLITLFTCLSSSRGSLINVNVTSVTLGFDPRPLSSRIKTTLSSHLLHNLKQVHD